MNNSIQDSVVSLLPPRRKTTPSGWTSFNAPCCIHNGESQDKRGRGGIITQGDGSISYHCFNCGFKTGWKPGGHLGYKMRRLLTWLGSNDNEIQRLVIEAVRIKDEVGVLTEIQHDVDVDFDAYVLPEGSLELPHWQDRLNQEDIEPFTECCKYLLDRDPDYDWPTYWSNTTLMKHRVIIPFMWRGNIVGYAARAIVDTIKPKYMAHRPAGYVFNSDRQTDSRECIIVVEGVFDAIAIDGVGVLGSNINESQADIIDSIGKEVIVVPDKDKVGEQLIDSALEYGWSVSFPDWHSEVKDVSDAVLKYGKLFTLTSIIEAKQSNKLKIELARKKLGQRN
jgi:hypothetical protein